MGCLYCGKEIGPIRILRDSEFCSSVHRKQYGSRLGKALGQIATPERPPAGIAGFRIDVHPFQGNHVTAPIYAGFQAGTHSIQVRRAWPLAVSVILPHRFQPSGAASAQLSPARPSFSETPLGRVRLLPLAVTCPVDPPSEEESIPAACLRYMPGPAAAAVEAWVAPVAAASIYPAIALRQKKYEGQIAPAALVPNYCQEFSPVPSPQAAETFVMPVMAAAVAPKSR